VKLVHAFLLSAVVSTMGCAGDGADSTSGTQDTGAATSGVDTDGSEGTGPEGTGSTSTESAPTATGTHDTSSSDTSAVPPCDLEESGPIVVSQDDQVIEYLHVISTDGPAIEVAGHTGVVIRNVRVEHAGGPGIEITGGADDVRIENVSVEHTGAPAEGQNPSDQLVNIVCYGSARPTVVGARLTRGSSGVYLVECPDAEVSFVEGHDFRGPFPRGQLVQFDKSDGGVLEDFSVVNPQQTSWPEDNVNVYQSIDIEIRRGLIDGATAASRTTRAATVSCSAARAAATTSARTRGEACRSRTR
jgi:hypothetical protein